MIPMIIRTYSELIKLQSFEERYQYLKLNGSVGRETFGYDRYLNQMFYNSKEWKSVRDYVIIRDNGLDLAAPGYDIVGKILIHHMNPISKEDVLMRSKHILDPEYLISTTTNTHNAIHYGDESLLITKPILRTKNDTCPWKK